MKRKFKVVAWVNYETNEAEVKKIEIDAEAQFIGQMRSNLISVEAFDLIG